jgi:hypothetical protein
MYGERAMPSDAKLEACPMPGCGGRVIGDAASSGVAACGDCSYMAPADTHNRICRKLAMHDDLVNASVELRNYLEVNSFGDCDEGSYFLNRIDKLLARALATEPKETSK